VACAGAARAAYAAGEKAVETLAARIARDKLESALKPEEGTSANVERVISDKHSSTPIGHKGKPLEVTPSSNLPSVIAGRNYKGHALDRMQERGVTPTVVEDTIQSTQGIQSHGSTVMHESNQLRVILNENGEVVTVIVK